MILCKIREKKEELKSLSAKRLVIEKQLSMLPKNTPYIKLRDLINECLKLLHAIERKEYELIRLREKQTWRNRFLSSISKKEREAILAKHETPND